MRDFGAWVALLAISLLFSETTGLRFNDDTYVVTIWETPAEMTLISDPPTPLSGVVVTARCINDNGTPVEDASDLRYNIVEGNMSLFSINDMSGQFSVVNEPFDYEEQPWYLVRLFCYLNSNPNNNGTGAVNVTIGHLNEYLPGFEDLLSATILIDETTPSGAIIAATDASIEPLLTYSATDEDSGPDGTILYILKAGDDNQFFELNEESGTLTLSAELDIDDLSTNFQQLVITMIVCNKNVQLDICKTKTFIIYVTSVNEFAPEFTESRYIASVNETDQNGTAILEVLCTDLDNKIATTLSITFHSDTPSSVLAAFELSSETLLLRSELDYENTTEYNFLLVCSDGDKTATTRITVNVLPQNDNMPYFTLDSDREYYELSVDRTDPSPSETIIGVVRAEDDDTDDVLIYSIDSSSHFKINAETGEISLKGYLYVKDGRVFDFEVVASDGEHETRARVRVTTTGLLSVPEWIFVGLGSAILLVILAIVGIIVLYCFIKAARVRIVEKYKERELDSDSEMQDIPVGPGFPNPHMFPPHPAIFPHDGGMSMVGQPLFPGMEDDEEEESEPSGTQGTLEGSQYNLTPGPILKEMVSYFHEGDKVLDKKGSKKEH